MHDNCERTHQRFHDLDFVHPSKHSHWHHFSPDKPHFQCKYHKLKKKIRIAQNNMKAIIHLDLDLPKCVKLYQYICMYIRIYEDYNHYLHIETMSWNREKNNSHYHRDYHQQGKPNDHYHWHCCLMTVQQHSVMKWQTSVKSPLCQSQPEWNMICKLEKFGD